MIANPNTRIVRANEDGRDVIIAVESPVKGVGLRRWSLVSSAGADVGLLRQAIPVINGASNGNRLPADVRTRLVELGILIDRKQVSTPQRLVCPLEAPARAPAIDPASLVLAAGVHLDKSGRVPGALGRELLVHGLDLDGPTAWVEDPVTRVVFPYRVPARWVAALERLQGGAPAAELPADARAAFHAAGILVSRADLSAHMKRARAIARARAQLDAQRACLPFSLGIPPLWLRAMQRHVHALGEEGWFGPSAQAPGRSMIHDEAASAFVHRQLVAMLTALTGQRWIPTYAYLARYREGADLEPHIDRGQCGLTISLQIELTPGVPRARAWPLHVELADGRVLPIRMLDGEGAAFHGTELRHWRRTLPRGAAGTYVFLHYVDHAFVGSMY